MLSIGRLRETLLALEPSPAAAAEITAEARAWAGLQLKPIGHLALELHRTGDWVADAVVDVEARLPGFGVAVLQALREPVNVYEARAADGVQTVVLVASAEGPDGALLLDAQITMPADRRAASPAASLMVTCTDLDDEEASCDRLAEIAAALTSQSLNGRDPDRTPGRAVWVGELSKQDTAALTHDLWARGYRLEKTLSSPRRRADWSAGELRRFKGEVVLIASGRCGGQASRMLASAPATASVITLDEDDSEQLRAEWQMVFADSSLDGVAGAPQASGAAVTETTWQDVKTAVEALQSKRFVLTDRAWKHLDGSCPYPKPDRMLDHLRLLAAAAETWGAAGGNVGGDFVLWAKTTFELNVSALDERLAKRKLDKFVFEDTEHSREPHVKVDDGVAFTDCGRIYFARDTGNHRFIVDHVGLHPYKLSSW